MGKSTIGRMGLPALFFLTLTLSAESQEPPLTDRERQLLELVGKLEERLTTVENELAELKAERSVEADAPDTGSQAALEARIAELEESRSSSLRAIWKEGLRFEDPDGDFKLRVGGRLFIDFGWFDQDSELKNVLDENDGGQIRMGRLNLQGEIYQDFFYRLEYDFAGNNGPSGFTDTYVGMNNIPYVGAVTVGHFKEPFGLEELTSDSYTTFMERSATSAFDPSRNLGIEFHNAWLGEEGKERLAAALGVFKNTDNWPSVNDSDEDQGWAVTGRVSGLPYYSDDGRKLIHLGAAYSHRNLDGATVNPYQIRPTNETRLTAFRWLDSDSFPGYGLRDARVDDVDLLGFEAAGVYGPFSLQGEYVMSEVETTFDGDRSFDGYYVYASYFLTGEHRPYDHERGIFSRLKPRSNFKPGKGLGAWELAVRYSHVDLDDGAIYGGEMENITLGLNWYLNPNVRWMLNYTTSDIDRTLFAGDLNILQMRFQVDF